MDDLSALFNQDAVTGMRQIVADLNEQKELETLCPVSSENVSDPPTDVELDAIFGTEATLPNGFCAIIDDAGVGTVIRLCYVVNSNWNCVRITVGGIAITNVIRITNAESPYTVLATDEVVFADTDGGVITVNLPAGFNGRHLKIINTGSSGNDATVDPNGTEELFGGGAGVPFALVDAENIDIHWETIENWW